VGRTDSGFRTDLYLLNTSSYGVPLAYTFHVRNGGADQPVAGDVTTYGTLGPGQAFQISDAISTLFPAIAGTVIGDLRIDYTIPQDAAQSSSRLVVESRNYAGGSQGTYGMQLPAYAPGDGLLPGSTGRILLPGLHNDADTAVAAGYDFTSRFGFMALGDGLVTVHADAYDQADGTLFWSGDYPLNGAAYGHFVFVSTSGQFAPAPFADHPRFDIVISATGSGNTPAGAFATVQDMRSLDLVFLPGKNAP
jgi:hypothetical protein